ncbi:MAG TPA: hypothetical protein VGQ57_10405 [Polyangiaceae bacterium]|nr:hypothetical protein [Polyangiaceae bacterium]
MSRLFVCAVALGAASALPGCRGCSGDHPYTPFGTTSALPSAEPAPSGSSAAGPSASGSGSPVEKSLLAPNDSRSWQVAGQTLTAPPGTVFDQALPASAGSGAVAWLVADATDAGPRAPGALWLFPAAGEPKKLVDLPGFVPSGPGCKLTGALARTGPHTVTLDVTGACPGTSIARTPVRALVVVAPDSDVPELLTLRVAAPADGETLGLAATTSDRDGDGRDDASIEVRVGKAGGASANAPLVWLDRAAGRSRDSSEPGRSLERAAEREAGRAKTKKVASEVLDSVAAIRRLLSTLCAEGTTPRLLDVDGNPFACGSLAGVVDALASAEISANLARGQVLEAFAVLERDGWYFGKTSAGVRQKLERQLLDAVTPVTATVKTLDPRPLVRQEPRLSPLAFDPSGGLLIQTFSDVERVAPDGSSSAPVPATPRNLDVLVAPGHRFSGAVFSCDRSEVTLTVDGQPPLVTGLLAPRPGICGHAPFFASSVPPVVAAADGKLRVMLGGSPAGNADPGPSPAGGARSPNGKWLVIPTVFGLFIDGPSHKLVHLGTAVPDPHALTDCVVNDKGDTSACVFKSQALLIRVGG